MNPQADPMVVFFLIVGKVTCALVLLTFLTLLVIVTAGKYPWFARQLARVVNWLQPDDTALDKKGLAEQKKGKKPKKAE